MCFGASQAKEGAHAQPMKDCGQRRYSSKNNVRRPKMQRNSSRHWMGEKAFLLSSTRLRQIVAVACQLSL
jgi:hypothetical protein